MRNYEELYLQIMRFENEDVITSSITNDKDNVGGANSNWEGWIEGVME